MTLAHTETAIYRATVRHEQYDPIRVTMDQTGYRAEKPFRKRVLILSIVIQLSYIWHTLTPDCISGGSDQTGIITGHLEWVN
jgi:hypothetical protein